MKIKLFSLEILAALLYVFCLNFERAEILPNFLISKITIAFLVLVFMLRIKNSMTFNLNILIRQFSYIAPFLIIYLINFINNIINSSSNIIEIFNIPFLLNIIILLIFINIFLKKPQYFDRLFDVFIYSTLIVSIFFIIGFDVEYYDGRASILSLNSNTIGLHSSISILLILNRFFNNRQSLIRTLVILPLFILLFSTASRISFVVFFLGILYIFFFNAKLISWKKFLSIIFLILTGPFLIYYFSESYVFQRFFLTFTEGDFSARDFVWSRIFSTFGNENILFGIGQNKYFDIAYNFNFASEDGISPHNVFIETFLYTGIIGLIAYIIFIYNNIKLSFSILKSKNNLIPLFFVTVIIGLSLSSQIFEQKLPWILMSYIITSSIVSLNAVKN